MIIFNSLADKVTTGTYNFVSLIVKVILIALSLSSLSLVLSLPATDRKMLFYLRFNSALQLINDILRDIQKLHKYFNGTATAPFFRIPFASSATMFSNNLTLYLKDSMAQQPFHFLEFYLLHQQLCSLII